MPVLPSDSAMRPCKGWAAHLPFLLASKFCQKSPNDTNPQFAFQCHANFPTAQVYAVYKEHSGLLFGVFWILH